MHSGRKSALFKRPITRIHVGTLLKVHPTKLKIQKFFQNTVKIEVQVHSIDNDDCICDGAMELAVPGLVSR